MESITKILFLGITLVFCAGFLFYFNNFQTNNTAIKTDSSVTAAISPIIIPTQPEPKTFNILIIPGHDVKNGGANYKDIYERDLVAIIGAKISDILSKQPGYKIIVARNTNNWNPIFTNYFQTEKQEIIDWKNQCQENEKALISSGKEKIIPEMGIPSEVSSDMSVKLYGMNKWANENNIDLVLNLHFNDEQRPDMNAPGDLSGFNIFIPDSQAKNYSASKSVAGDVYTELKKIEVSESGRLLEDQNLIALGASGTLNEPSMLIEYAYIYEKNLRTEPDRDKALDQMAEQTAFGVENYVNNLNNK